LLDNIESLNVCQTKNKHQSICFTRIWDFTWRMSDCEELVGVTHRRWGDR